VSTAYVKPICVLRDKGSEWQAIGQMLQAGGMPVQPVIEAVCEPFIPRRGRKTPSPKYIASALAGRLSALATAGVVRVDCANLLHMLSPFDVAEFMSVVRHCLGLHAHQIVPVVRTNAPQPVVDEAIAWARAYDCGLCIRTDGLSRLAELSARVDTLLSESRLVDGMIDLITDAQDLPRLNEFPALAAAFPIATRARLWAVVAGTFPASITDLSPEKYEHTLDRDEWQVYEEEVARELNYEPPAYGDYATQAAIYKPSPAFPASPTVRYTTERGFTVIRGRRRKNLSYEQYIGHARFLKATSYFEEITVTAGDKYVREIAKGTNGTGNPTTWRVASILRHIEMVKAQTRALYLTRIVRATT
jgi:hypothetical protein